MTDRMKFKADILDKDAVERAIARISHQILERNSGARDVVLIG